MGRILTGLAASALTAAGLSASPANADFAISKPKEKAQKPAQPRAKGARNARGDGRNSEAARPPADLGIDPALMRETIAEARYSATLTRDVEAKTALIQATDGKTGWSVNFADCSDESHCGSLEFYTLWKVTNEANVCTAWRNDVTKDPTRGLGKPFCYTVPALPKQLHLKLSSEQGPYLGMAKLTPAQAKERMQGMIGVWAAHLPMLPQAWKVASSKCPRVSDKCV